MAILVTGKKWIFRLQSGWGEYYFLYSELPTTPLASKSFVPDEDRIERTED
ncbi:hypothetical protein JCM18694_21060 [Prolixibacter denitrificans]|uniref:Uncharacterized protein n=1 Tax=Prolixibacter denitrificans TaxID=1541063 RepID=A0ABQ0ZK88_9BACT|nr:hypothetical protein JCM18694_21060 [Prolixibacter denitrificans]